jgi:hypothetical protein
LLVVVELQENEYGAVVSNPPRFAPSTWNCTLATPTLSDAFAVTETTPVTVAPFAGAVKDTVGGVVSGGGALFTVNIIPLLDIPETLTITFPEVAPLGTGTAMLVPLHELEFAPIPLNVIVLVPWVDPKLVPLIVTI